MTTHPLAALLLLLLLLVMIWSASASEFVFNRFNHSDLLLYGYAQLDPPGILSLTNDTQFTSGRGLYPTKIPAKRPNSSYVLPFSASFIFAMAPYPHVIPGHGIVFLFLPFPGINGSNSAEHLGFLNRTNNGRSDNHMFGVEFDVFENQEFNDIDDNHVGVNVNSLTSNFSTPAGYWPGAGRDGFKELKLNDGTNYQVWVDYRDARLNVSMAPAGIKRPQRNLLSVDLNLSDVFLDEMYVGFTSATGTLAQSHKILAWSFSNSNFSLSDELITTGLPSFRLPAASILKSKGFIAGVTVGSFVLVFGLLALGVFCVIKKHRRDRLRADMEEWEFEYWPHRMTYQEIEAATKGFSAENVIGVGGNGKVYKGVLDGLQVAVKCISHDNGDDGMREFLAEISSLGRLKHRNLVGLRGWCKREKGSFMLVYDYMENGSLDRRVFECEHSFSPMVVN
uniref:non-specific serine/threonine protein kinase n=1 Tax=Kalanchoe fedtschenkoi TaxID=63787 RepID=A0A7N0SVV2_KALFE